MSDFRDLWDSGLINEEMKAEIDLEVSLIGKLIEAREQKGITQAKLAELTGLKQSAIARLETMSTTPKIDTMLKLLKPLGYTLAIVSDTPPMLSK